MIELRNITKSYGAGKGVEDISFCLMPGSLTCFIGPNGAGKSTLLNIISGMTAYDSGELIIDGKPFFREIKKNDIGYMPDQLTVNPRLKVKELLLSVSAYKYKGAYVDQLNNMITDLEVGEYLYSSFGSLSMGNKKKVSLIIAFLGNPRVLFLDEPTNGLDASGVIILKEYLKRRKSGDIDVCDNFLKENERGGYYAGNYTIVSTHALDFADKITDRSIFLKKGRIIADSVNVDNVESMYRRLY